ncbi:hypothetical protein [Methylomicrobium lacus]|uniref:hypothetical protein n=1 Tax=Methylomicrobium lacus TaxID=136992 RepID=UPI0035A90624
MNKQSSLWILLAMMASALTGCALYEPQSDLKDGFDYSAPIPQAINPKTSANVNAKDWISCNVQPAGSLMRSVKKKVLTSFWKTTCAQSDNCGCIDGLADGSGFARWCDSTTLCTPNDSAFYGAATGLLNQGRFAAIEGKILVTLNTKRGLYDGAINGDGSYAAGMLTQLSSGERFIGLLAGEDGRYLSGVLYKDGKVIVADRFDGAKPLGRVLTTDADGNFAESECDAKTCREVNRSQNSLIADLFKLVSENKAQDIATRRVLSLIGREAILTHPAVRAFDALSMASEIVELVQKRNPQAH